MYPALSVVQVFVADGPAQTEPAEVFRIGTVLVLAANLVISDKTSVAENAVRMRAFIQAQLALPISGGPRKQLSARRLLRMVALRHIRLTYARVYEEFLKLKWGKAV
ncbi:MAG: hypothetical protein ACOYBP_04400 [Microbacteriaceae bacterium]